ncbi:Sodium-coupled monocarboxylate transporter 2 [Lucilia cuprina]|nr:Sodium-coupled monocarboxylate transporter 2 [Lucilia cuprina]
MFGGIKAVVWTDVVQAAIMVVSVVLVGILGAYKVGGFGEVFRIAAEGGRLDVNFAFDATTRSTFWNCFISSTIMWTSYVGLNQSCVQRIVSLPTLKHARHSLIIFGFGFVIIMAFNCITGIVMYARYHDCDPLAAGFVEKADKLMPFFVQDVVGHLKGMPGVFISCVFSAALSTMSASMNSLAGIVYFDYIKPRIKHTERRANLIMKALVLFTGVYCILAGVIVEKFTSILQMVYSIGGVTFGAVFGVFMMGMLVPKAHGKAAFYSVVSSMLAMLIIVLAAQGRLHYKTLPGSVEYCPDLNITLSNTSPLLNMALETTDFTDKAFNILDMSFNWYVVLGTLIVFGVGVPFSYILTPEKGAKFDVKLLSPLIQPFVNYELAQVEEELPEIITSKPPYKKMATTILSTVATVQENLSKSFTFSTIDYIVFVLMLSISAGIGVYFGFFSKAKNTTDEYLMGSKQMKTIPIAISLIARTRQLATASFVLNACLMLPVYIFVPSLAFSQVTGINIHLINTAICSICIFYTMLGGIKAVVWTDVVQAGIMISSVVLVGVLGTLKVGGLNKVLEYAGEGGRLDFNFSMDPRVRSSFWNLFSGGLLLWVGHIGLNQSCVQRIVSMPSLNHARKTCIDIINIILFQIVEKADKMMPFFVQDVMGHLSGMPGLFISCVFSAALSTMSAMLNSVAGVVYFDYIKPFIRHTDARANSIIKICVVAMGCYCILGGFIVQRFTSILQTIITITGISTGAVVGVFLLGMFVPRVNSKVAFLSIAFSVGAMLWIIINAQMRFKSGLIKYEPLPTSLHRCESLNFPQMLKNITSTPISLTSSEKPLVTGTLSSNREFSIYEISFYWYKLLGAIFVWLSAIPMSYIWKRDKDEKMNPKLYSPFVKRFLRQPVIETEEVRLTKMATSIASTVATTAEIIPKSFTFGTIDYIVFVLMLCVSAGIGVYFGFFSKSSNTTDEYLMGSKKMKTIPIAISLIASQLSGIAIMSVPAESYSFGFTYIFLVLSIVPVVPILNYIIVPVFYNNNISNCYEYLQLRFNKRTRQIVTGSFVLNACLMLPVYIFVPALAFSQVTGMNIHLINTVGGIKAVVWTDVVQAGIMLSSGWSYKVLEYADEGGRLDFFFSMDPRVRSTFWNLFSGGIFLWVGHIGLNQSCGGIKAVVWTDVVQAGIMLSSVILVAVLGTLKVGGLNKVLEYADEGGRLDFFFSMDPRVRSTFWNLFSGGIFLWVGHIGLNQSCVQKIVSLPSLNQARKSLIIVGIGVFIIMSFNCFIGLIMFARYFGCDPILAGIVEKADKMMPFFVQDVMGHLLGMPGIFISCVFSAALSTMSAMLNSLAGVVYFDYIKPFIRHTDARANNIMKIFVVAMGCYCILGGFVVQRFSSILQSIITITGINTGAVVGVFLLGMFVPRVNGKVAFLSIAFSVGVMLWIIIHAQMRFKAGYIKYEALPTSLERCEALNLHEMLYNISTNVPVSLTTTETPLVTGTLGSNREFSIYEISFYWYNIMGVFLVWLSAIPMSFIWKRDQEEKINPKLYSPFVKSFLNHSVAQMEELPLKTPHPSLAENNATISISDKENGIFYNNNISNCYEYLELRFNKRTRQLVTGSFVLNACLMLPVYIFVPALAFSQVTGINIHLINTVVCSICIFYTMLGGIKAVVWTDVVQAGIMLSSVVLVGVLGTLKVGGLNKVLEYAGEGGRLDFNFSMDPRIRSTFWNLFSGGILLWVGHIGLNQSCVQRIVSLPSLQQARKALIIVGIGVFIIMSFNSFIGLVMFARYYGCDPILGGIVEKADKMMPFFVQDVMGHLLGMPGIFISCVFSAALSTMSAMLNSVAGVVYFDYIKPFIKHTDARANNIMKIFVVAMGCYCILGGFMVQRFTSILQTIITITGINTGAVVGVFLLGMFVPRVSGKVAFLSIAFSVGVMLWIIINSQMSFKAGYIKYEPLPTSLERCENINMQGMLQNTTSSSMPLVTNEEPLVTGTLGSNRDFSIYEVSFYWYKLMGVLLVWLSAIPMSYIWKRDKEEKMNPKLYSPFVKSFLSQPVVQKEEVPLKTPPPSLVEDHATISISEKDNENDIKC